ncbi:esterase 1 [Agrocybe pediades]|nr:esterase 1 [Agrocybe pediades]
MAIAVVDAISTLPVVTFGQSSIVGALYEPSAVEFFGGIPYAKPPLGQLRLRPPVLLQSLPVKVLNAQNFGLACLQNEIPADAVSEDCLTLNVFRPAGATTKAKLPVMIWIHGGNFFVGSSSLYNATGIVVHAVRRGTPVIIVSINYRLGPLGFPQGVEVGNAGPEVMNLGLQDQFAAFQWVHNNIEHFGGDKSKVTLFGESAGAYSINILLQHTKIRSLARAAILESMGVLPIFGPERSEAIWQDYVSAIPGCASAASSNSTIECIRNATSAEVLQALTTAGLVFSNSTMFLPVLDGPDGLLVGRQSQVVLNKARLPIMMGNNLDEGTLFTPQNVADAGPILGFLNSSTSPSLVSQKEHLRVIEKILELYPNDPALGSPFGTGNETFGLNSQFKRFSAISGDWVLQAPRRTLVRATSAAGVKVFSYLFTDRDGTIIPELITFTPAPGSLGVPHTAEIYYVFNILANRTANAVALSSIMQDYWISFAISLDPNDKHGNASRPYWEQYTPKNPVLLELNGHKTAPILDTFREKQISFIQDHPEALHV